MEIKIGKREYLWGYFGYFYKYGMRLLTTPFVWHYLDKTDLDIWYVFMSISMFVGLLDFGFSPNVSRAVTYAFSGAKRLQKEGVAGGVGSGDGTNYVLLAALISACKKVYACIAGAALLLLGTAGTWYLLKVLGKYEAQLCPTHVAAWEEGDRTFYFLLIWGFFVLSQVVDIYFKYIGVLVGGRGLVGVTQKFGVVSSVAGIGATFLVLYLGYGLLGTVAVGFGLSIVTRIFFGWLFFKKIDPQLLPRLRAAWKTPEKPDVLGKLWHNSWKLGVNSLGVFALYQLTVLLSGLLFKESYITQVGITLQVFNVLILVSNAWFNMSSPRYASLFVLRKFDVLRREFLQAMLLSIALFFGGLAVILLFGNDILRLLGKDKILLPGTGVLLLYCAVFLTELIHGKCATFLLTKNVVPFVPATLASSAASILLIVLFTQVFGFGIAAFPLATFCANAVYNSWHWPLEVVRHYGFTLRDAGNLVRHARAFVHYRVEPLLRTGTQRTRAVFCKA